MESSSLAIFKDVWMWNVGTWFSGEYCIVGLTVGLDDLKGLF